MDELEKIAASRVAAPFMQRREGIRPIRVHNLLGRDTVTQDPEMEPAEPPEADQAVDGGAEKTAREKPFKEKALETFAKARPYVASGVKAGLPMAAIGNLTVGRKTGIVAGTVGTAAGVVNEALKQWAEKNKRKSVAKKILED